MGNGASTKIPKNVIKRENIRDRNRLVRSVEKFIICANSTCSRTECMWNILASKSKFVMVIVQIDASDSDDGVGGDDGARVDADYDDNDILHFFIFMNAFVEI